LGFVATEKCDEIEPVDPEALTGSHLCPGCEVMEEKCPGLCEDPPEVESVKSMLSIEDEPESCLNCTFKNLGIEDEPCDGCFDRNEWKGMPVMDEGPTPCADEAESLYRAGCWTTLENRMHDLMSEWSLIADKCKCRIEVEDCDEIKCTFCDTASTIVTLKCAPGFTVHSTCKAHGGGHL
jgi:hypothetical protein